MRGLLQRLLAIAAKEVCDSRYDSDVALIRWSLIEYDRAGSQDDQLDDADKVRELSGVAFLGSCVVNSSGCGTRCRHAGS